MRISFAAASVVAAVAVVAAAPAPAAAKTIKLPASVIGQVSSYTEAGFPRCSSRQILIVAVPKQVVSYSASVQQDAYSFGTHYTTVYPFHGPPFTNPITGYGPPYTVPSGEAGWFIGGGSGPQLCTTGVSGWRNAKATGVIPSDLVPISGTATDETGAPVPDAEVRISGPSSTTVRTDSIGAYVVLVKKGHYTVTAGPPPGDAGYHVKATTCDTGTASTDSCDGDTGDSGLGADFDISPPKHIISFHFSPPSVTADGHGHFDGVVNDSDEFGNPIVGEALQLTPPADVDPPAVVCSPTAGLIYPQTLSSGEPLGTHPVLTTDAGGNIPLAIWPGTVGGDWDLTADEVAHPTVSNYQLFPFAARAAAGFPTNVEVAQEFANAVRGTIAGTTGVNIFHNFGAVGQSAAANQAVLLAFLDSVPGAFPGADFGPVTDGSAAGVLFYPQGTLSAGEGSDPTTGIVLDLTQAEAIVQAIADNQPIPAPDEALSSWAGWRPDPGATPALGPLAPYPGQQFTYFGLPYPPAAGSLADVTSFCAQPDPELATYQTQSPITLAFTSAGGAAPDGVQLRAGEITTYIVPAGAYRVAITGTGAGTAHLVMVSDGTGTERIHTFVFAVRKGEKGSLAVSSGGSPGTLAIGSKHMRAAPGLVLSLSGLPRSLKAGRRTTLKLLVSYTGQPMFGAQVRVQGDGVRASGTTNGIGRAQIAIRPGRHGRVAIAVTRGDSVLRSSLRVR
jgi:Carboxypeptidase regulatory-like domain